jgi:hypothetical protein
MSTLDQMIQILPLGQIILFDRKEYLLLDNASSFMDDPSDPTYGSANGSRHRGP